MIMCCKQSQHCVNFGEFDECFGEFLKPESCSLFAKKEETITKRVLPQWLKDYLIMNIHQLDTRIEDARLRNDIELIHYAKRDQRIYLEILELGDK